MNTVGLASTRFATHPLKPEHFPSSPTPGVPVDVFLRLPSDRVPADAPYSRELSGHSQLNQHQKLQKLVQDATLMMQAAGATSPLTLSGLALALRKQSGDYEGDAREQSAQAQAILDKPILKRLGHAVGEGVLSACRGTALGSGTLMTMHAGGGVLLALKYGIQAVAPYLGHFLAAGAAMSLIGGGVVGVAMALDGGRRAFGSEEVKELQGGSQFSQSRASEIAATAGDLEQWNQILAKPSAP